jgi:hypothetical protein
MNEALDGAIAGAVKVKRWNADNDASQRIARVRPRDKKVNLRRNASTRASAIVEGSSAPFVESSLLTSASR